MMTWGAIMDDEKLRDLESESTSDFDNAERISPAKRPRTVVSVSFSREEIELVASDADRNGTKLSAYIRNAAVGKARTEPQVTSLKWFGATAGSFSISIELGPATQVSSPTVQIS